MKTHTTTYQNTFIRIAPDSKAQVAEAPPDKEPKSAVRLAFEMIRNKPYQHSSDDVLYETAGKPKGLSREAVFQKGQPCFRASMLTKRYGWGLHSNQEGKIALIPAGTPAYDEFCENAELQQLTAMRNSR